MVGERRMLGRQRPCFGQVKLARTHQLRESLIIKYLHLSPARKSPQQYRLKNRRFLQISPAVTSKAVFVKPIVPWFLHLRQSSIIASHFPIYVPAKHPPRLPITGRAGSRIAEAGAVNSTTPSTDIGLLGAHNGPGRGGCFAGKSNARQTIITSHGREGSSLKKCQVNLSFWKIYLTLLSRFNARRNRAALDDSPQPHLTAVPGTT